METQGIEVKLTEVEARSKSNTKRLDDVENRLSEQEKLVNSVIYTHKRNEPCKERFNGG